MTIPVAHTYMVYVLVFSSACHFPSDDFSQISIEDDTMAIWYFSQSHSAKSPDFKLTEVRKIHLFNPSEIRC